MSSQLISKKAELALSYIDKFKQISYLRNLIRIPSYLGREEEKANYISKELERIGVEVFDNILGPSLERRNVLGVIRGKGNGKKLLIGAHIDTFWPVKGQEKLAHEAIVKDGKIYGLGVGDNMTAMAAFMGSLDAIVRSGIELSGDVIFLASSDELGEKRGALVLEENQIEADMCILGEATGDFDIGITHSGKVEVEIEVKGSMETLLEGYGEVMGMKPVNAVRSMAKVILYLETMVEKEPYFHNKHVRLPGEGAVFYIGPIIGGNTGYGSPYVKTGEEYGLASPPPVWCKLRCGARYWPGQNAQDFVKLIEKYVHMAQKDYPGFDVNINCYLDHGNTPIDTSENAEPVQVLKRVIKYVRNREPKLIGNVYSTEGPFYERLGIPVVWTAPGMLRVGRPDEYVTIEELIDCCKIYTASIIEICS